MGIVASAASGVPGMLARDDLRERFRLGRVRLVANHAELCGVGKERFLTGEVLRVASERPVAGFASDIGMRTFAFCRDDVGVAGSAGLAAGEDGSLGGDFIEGAGAVMSILAEPRGNEGMANRQERQHENNRDQSQPDEMFRALKDSPHAACKQANAPPFAAKPVELPRALRSHASKALRRRTVATGGWKRQGSLCRFAPIRLTLCAKPRRSSGIERTRIFERFGNAPCVASQRADALTPKAP